MQAKARARSGWGLIEVQTQNKAGSGLSMGSELRPGSGSLWDQGLAWVQGSIRDQDWSSALVQDLA